MTCFDNILQHSAAPRSSANDERKGSCCVYRSPGCHAHIFILLVFWCSAVLTLPCSSLNHLNPLPAIHLGADYCNEAFGQNRSRSSPSALDPSPSHVSADTADLIGSEPPTSPRPKPYFTPNQWITQSVRCYPRAICFRGVVRVCRSDGRGPRRGALGSVIASLRTFSQHFFEGFPDYVCQCTSHASL